MRCSGSRPCRASPELMRLWVVGELVPRVGFELTTYRLRSGCSTAELSGRAGCSRAYLSHRGGGAKPLAGDRAPSREGDRASTPSPGISGDGSISDALT